MKVSQCLSLLLVMTTIAACIQSTESTATSSPVVPSRASATKIILPALSPTATSTLTSLPTLTAVSTLPVEDARERLLERLANNGNCHLSCLWGITPGKSNYQEARIIFHPLSSIAETAPFFEPSGLVDDNTLSDIAETVPTVDSSNMVDDITLLYIEGDLRLNTRIAYVYGSDAIVNHIVFRVLEEDVPTDSNGNWISKTPIYDLPTFMERTEYYSLHHLLTEQGIPDSVLIYTSGKKGVGSIEINIAVFYPNQGIWAQYDTYINENDVNDIINICPLYTHVEMELFPPGNPDSFFSLLDQTDWQYTKGGFKSLEEASSMSIEEFYQTFRNPTNQCLETPVEIWPPPS